MLFRYPREMFAIMVTMMNAGHTMKDINVIDQEPLPCIIFRHHCDHRMITY